MKSATTLIPQAQGTAPSRVVIDTNAVLDLWAFADPRVAPLKADVENGRLEWMACAAMRHELALVLARGVGAAHGAVPEAVLAAWDRHARLLADPAPAGHPLLRCRDGDDQVFLDVALATQSQCLLTSDRDLLSLRRRAARLGLRIARPQEWDSKGPDAAVEQGLLER